MGRWLSRDPLGEGVDYNLYRYCGNDPVGSKDPTGLVGEIVLPRPIVLPPLPAWLVGGAAVPGGAVIAGGAVAAGGGAILTTGAGALQAHLQARAAEAGYQETLRRRQEQIARMRISCFEAGAVDCWAQYDACMQKILTGGLTGEDFAKASAACWTAYVICMAKNLGK